MNIEASRRVNQHYGALASQDAQTQRWAVALFLSICLLLASCSSDSPSGPDWDYYNFEPPTWALEVLRTCNKIEGETLCTPPEIVPDTHWFKVVADLNSQCWLDHHEGRGAFRPGGMPPPKPPTYAKIEVEPNCSNSGESQGEGGYGCKIKAYSCTRKQWYTPSQILSLWKHFLDHKISGYAGNSSHGIYEEVCPTRDILAQTPYPYSANEQMLIWEVDER